MAKYNWAQLSYSFLMERHLQLLKTESCPDTKCCGGGFLKNNFCHTSAPVRANITYVSAVLIAYGFTSLHSDAADRLNHCQFEHMKQKNKTFTPKNITSVL